MSYVVTPNYDQQVDDVYHLAARLDVPARTAGPVEVGFTLVPQGQFVPLANLTKGESEYLPLERAGEAGRLVSRFFESASGSGSSLAMVLDDLDSAIELDKRARSGGRVQVLLCESVKPASNRVSARSSVPNLKFIAKGLRDAGFDVRISQQPRKVHGFTVVRLEDGVPEEVLVSSASLTRASFHSHNEHVMPIKDRQVASVFMDDFRRLWDDMKHQPIPRWRTVQMDTGTIGIGFAHSDDWLDPVIAAIESASVSIYYSLLSARSSPRCRWWSARRSAST